MARGGKVKEEEGEEEGGRLDFARLGLALGSAMAKLGEPGRQTDDLRYHPPTAG